MNIQDKVIYIIAAEPSGDFIGSRLINSIKKRYSNIKIIGIGGHLMYEEGINSLIDIKYTSIMGFINIIPKIFKILKLIKKTISDIEKHKPDILITIDSPGFNIRIAKAIRKKCLSKIKLIHYVAPTVWAYKPSRAKKFSRIFDYLLCILPFEPKFFIKEGLKSYYVGHPIIESNADKGKKQDIINKYKLSEKYKYISILPGSREQEIKIMLPIFLKSVEYLKLKYKSIKIIIPTIPSMKNNIIKYLHQNNLKDILVIDNVKDKYDAFNLSIAAIATSGTVSFELAMANIKTIIAYKVNIINKIILKILIKIKFVSIINIIANKELILELINSECTVKNIYNNLICILNNSEYDKNSKEIYNILKTLGKDNFIPSDKATDIILKILKNQI